MRKATLTITQGAEQQVAMIPSSKVYSVHTLTNNGNVSETFALAAANLTDGVDTLDATAVKIYLDANGNGVLDSGETTPITSTTLAAGASAKLIVESVLPAAIAVDDVLKVSLDATDSKGNTASSTSADGSPDLTDNTATITFKDTNVDFTPVIWEQAAGGNCHAYGVVKKNLSWWDSLADSDKYIYNGKRGRLVTIASAEENAFVLNVAKAQNSGTLFIGGGRKVGGGAFFWAKPGVAQAAWDEPFAYTNWSTAQPDNSAGAEAQTEMYTDGRWNDIASSANKGYLIEFEIDCPLPSVAVELEGAKDVACDGEADGAFGTERLAEMDSGQCAILRTRATNGGKSLAKGVDLHYTLPQYASYVAGSLTFGGAVKTDAADTDVGKYDAA
ncbi:lectin-like protein [Candidatus Thiothrix anitrata]|uniref:C-type lectin domain-containing protein n=1 Tax=Candidatus Thiothrix anitrata TaxID=2823902 RepID=A0ABX7X2M8_9GAMM|nr:lectin-like protein [Candidatus Thiothrix anitrata]QTR50155.1 hypothetical protein J8380_00785 [Candidatus Thiothrix anitrata]